MQQLLACLNFTLDSEDLFCWYKRKKWFLQAKAAAAQAAENHGDVRALTWYLCWGKYTSIPNWTHSQNSIAAAAELRYRHRENISNHHKDRPNLNENSHKLCDEAGKSYFVLLEKSVEIETTTWSEFLKGGESRKKEIQKSRAVKVTDRDLNRKVNHLSKVIWEIMAECTRSISSTRKG